MVFLEGCNNNNVIWKYLISTGDNFSYSADTMVGLLPTLIIETIVYFLSEISEN